MTLTCYLFASDKLCTVDFTYTILRNILNPIYLNSSQYKQALLE